MRGTLITLAAGVLLAACVSFSNSSQSAALGAPERLAGTQSPPSNGALRAIKVAASKTAPTTAGYKIGAMDVLDISVFQVPELTKSVQVADTGTINLPLVGEIAVVGKTAQQVERDLTARLGAKYLQNPQVTVYVKEYNSQQVTISGEIKKPGVFPLKGRTSLLQLIALAGGFEDDSDSTVLVLRESNGKKSAATFDVSAIQKGRANDPALQSGDIVVAGKSAIKAGFNAILKALPVAGLFSFL
jgi:polysaccharide export outer membrane protein